MLRSEEGVSAVEFALISPLLFAITFGIIEFGLLLFNKAVITNASREGARTAIVYNKSGGIYDPVIKTDIEDVVMNYAEQYLVSFGVSSNSLTRDDITITPPISGAARGDNVTVRVDYTYSFLVFDNLISLLGGSYADGFPLVGRTTMRRE